MRRSDREVKDLQELENILQTCHAVHIGAQDGEGMFVVPMNYGYRLEGERLTLYIHSAPEGRKVSVFRAGGNIALRWTAATLCAQRTPLVPTAIHTEASWALGQSGSWWTGGESGRR